MAKVAVRRTPTAHTIVYIGTSVTVGWAASNRGLTSYRALSAAALAARYPQYVITAYDKGVNGTGSGYGLVRLGADVVALAPSIVVVEFVPNDDDSETQRRVAEALLRRLRTDLPIAQLVFVASPVVVLPSANNVRASVQATWTALCTQYDVPLVDFSGEVLRAVTAGEHETSWYMSDHAHPSDNGHATINALLMAQMPNPAAAQQWTPPLPSRLYDNGEYESPPVIRDATDNDGTIGTWTTNGTYLETSEAEATVTFTDTTNMVGLDAVGVGGDATLAWRQNGGDWHSSTVGVTPLYPILTSGLRDSYTYDLKFTSGFPLRLRRWLGV